MIIPIPATVYPPPFLVKGLKNILSIKTPKRPINTKAKNNPIT